jgi:hypothetical protein
VEEVSDQERESRYSDKLELVFREYERTHDLDVALSLVPLSEEDRERLLDDPDLGARIVVSDARLKTELFENALELSRSAESEGVRLSAIKELGRTLYPKRFKDAATPPQEGGSRVVRYMLVEPTLK